MPFAKVAVEFLEGNPLIAVDHVGERLVNGGDVRRRCLRVGMQPPPFVDGFFRRPISVAVLPEVRPVGRGKLASMRKFAMVSSGGQREIVLDFLVGKSNARADILGSDVVIAL